eukprot:TRINITY_DN31591_c0_g1_i1.p1 TRINITY_DN31591_c0_g1~~TRINITY_DN31591_c0_g1_i1.p1  ORF type:complete len:171 (-),score=26.12 TRINITY_DN31591_c0_g1_i1:198-710(-)
MHHRYFGRHPAVEREESLRESGEDQRCSAAFVHITSSPVELLNSSRVFSCGLENEGTVQLVRANNTMEIIVTGLGMRGMFYRISGDASVHHLKNMVAVREGVPPTEQRCLFASRDLEDHQRLFDCGVQEGSTLTVVLRLGPRRLRQDEVDDALARAAEALRAAALQNTAS